jgi:hypothetical protein
MMMNAGEVNIKVGISLTRQEYSILKEGIKDDECGWSNALRGRCVYVDSLAVQDRPLVYMLIKL